MSSHSGFCLNKSWSSELRLLFCLLTVYLTLNLVSPFPHLAEQNKHYKTCNQSSAGYFHTPKLLTNTPASYYFPGVFLAALKSTHIELWSIQRKKEALTGHGPEKSIDTKSAALTISIFAPSRHFSPIWLQTQSRPAATDRDGCGDSKSSLWNIRSVSVFEAPRKFMKCADLIFFGQCLLWKSCANVEKIKPVSGSRGSSLVNK